MHPVHCLYCDSNKVFQDTAQLERHLSAEHADRFSSSQLPTLCDFRTQGSNSISVRKCPFCDWHTKLHYAGSKEQVSIDRYRRHICAHLEQVASAVIGEAVDESEQGGSDAQGQLNRGFDFGSEDEGQDDTWSTTTDDEDVTYQGNDYASQSPMSRDAKHTVGIDGMQEADERSQEELDGKPLIALSYPEQSIRKLLADRQIINDH